MRDRKRKMPDRKSPVFDRLKSFSFRKQKLSYVRSKIRLGFSCGVSGMLAVGIIGNSNIRVLTQLVWSCVGYGSSCTNVLVGYLLKASALAAVQAWPQYCVLPAVRAAPLYSIYICFFRARTFSSTSQRGSFIASFIYSSANCSQPRCTPPLVLLSIEYRSSARSRQYDN